MEVDRTGYSQNGIFVSYFLLNHDYRHDAAVSDTCFRLDRFQVKNLDGLDLFIIYALIFCTWALGTSLLGFSSVEVYFHTVLACGFCMVA